MTARNSDDDKPVSQLQTDYAELQDNNSDNNEPAARLETTRKMKAMSKAGREHECQMKTMKSQRSPVQQEFRPRTKSSNKSESPIFHGPRSKRSSQASYPDDNNK